MRLGCGVLVVLLGIARLCASQTTVIDRIVSGLDVNRDANITRSELETVFVANVGSNVTDRCRFVEWLVVKYGEVPLTSSALYDVMQSRDGYVSTVEIAQNILGSQMVLTVAAVKENIMKLYDLTNKVIAKPADYTSGPSYWPYTEFDVNRWASTADRDQSNDISRAEISSIMRSLDQNGDWVIELCEFVNSMALYKQHSVTASKVYSQIFHGRDATWADVDSDFLKAMILESYEETLTKDAFERFFALKNQVAAGIPVEPGEDPWWVRSLASSQHGGIAFWCMTSSVLAVLICHVFPLI